MGVFLMVHDNATLLRGVDMSHSEPYTLWEAVFTVITRSNCTTTTTSTTTTTTFTTIWSFQKNIPLNHYIYDPGDVEIRPRSPKFDCSLSSSQ